MRIYIAGPFFNQEQRNLILAVEAAVCNAGLHYYSPMTHSGSSAFTPEDRKRHSSWTPIIQSNIAELYRCDLVLAVLEYAMPQGIRLVPSTRVPMEYGGAGGEWNTHPTAEPVEIPDSGTVWECGAAHILSKPTYGFRRTESKKRNLMLSHTLNGCIIGYSNLALFMQDVGIMDDPPYSHNLAPQFAGEVE